MRCHLTTSALQRILARQLFLTLLMSFIWGCTSPSSKTQGSVSGAGELTSLSSEEFERYKQALSELANHKPQNAEPSLRKLTQDRPYVPELWLNLALSQYQQENFDGAQDTLLGLFRLNDTVPQGYNVAGLVSVQQGLFDQAVKHYRRALELDPNYANALYNMALLHDVYLQDIARAVGYYERYLAVQTEDSQTRDWAQHLKRSLEHE